MEEVGSLLKFLRANWIRLLTILFLIALVGGIIFERATTNTVAQALGVVANSNERLTQEISAQNVVVAQLTQEKEALVEEKELLVDQLEEIQQYLNQTVPIMEVMWCTDMPFEVIPPRYVSIVQAIFEYLNTLETEVDPSMVCVDLFSVFGSPQTGEIYVSVKREFPGGASEWLLIYFEPIPESPGYVSIVGHWDVITRRFIPIQIEEPTEGGQ